jgi:hypothetical protein
MYEWVMVFCRGLYKESKRKWLIKQHSKERKEEEEINNTNERNYESNRE